MKTSYKFLSTVMFLTGLALACATTPAAPAPDMDAAVQQTLVAQTAEAGAVDVIVAAQTAEAQSAETSPTNTPVPAATPTAAASSDKVFLQKTVDLPPTWTLDLDTGTIAPASGADLMFNAVTESESYFEPYVQGVYFAPWIPPANFEPPNLANCGEQLFSDDPISADNFNQGDYVCFKTDENRTGVMRIVGAYAIEGSDVAYGITLDITIWNPGAVSAPPPDSGAGDSPTTINLPPTWTVDLDTGTVGPASGADLFYSVLTGTEAYFEVYSPNASLAYMYGSGDPSPPSSEKCAQQFFSQDPIDAISFVVGDIICFVTDEGRSGMVEIVGFYSADGYPDNQGITLEITFWK